MWRLAGKFVLFLAAFVLTTAYPAAADNGVTLRVNCGGKGVLSTITEALQQLDPKGPSTLIVSGACHENVVIQSFDRLTLRGEPGASVTDASGGADEVLSIDDSRRVRVEGFTINGGGGVSITNGDCDLVGNTIQNSLGNAVTVLGARVFLGSDLIQNNVFGLYLFKTADVTAVDLIVQGSTSHDWAIGISYGSVLAIGRGSVVQNNAGDGIAVGPQSILRLSGTTVARNGGNGVAADGVSSVDLAPLANTISNNGGAGVLLGDLSFASFRGRLNVVTGNVGPFDVTCNPQFSATRGALTNTGGGTTNCVEP